MWYLQYHRTWAWLCHSLILILLFTLAGSEENLTAFTLERQSLFASHRQSRWLNVRSYDLNGNIIEKTSTPQDNNYRYDARDRLVADSKNNNNEQQFDYDLNDNRIRQQQAINSLIDQYIYKDNSNQLSSQTRVVADNAPPPVNDRELVYNDAGRLFQLIDNGELKAEYIYNDQGQRSRKILHHSDGSTQTIIYHYTINNQLISETNQNGQLIRDYIWMETGYPVAQIDHNNGTERLLYLHDDHLMTARLATDTNQNIVWHWDGDAFGGTEPVASGGVSVNMRFPGQYFDLESGLFYNWNRYYDPGLGRYVTSDPIGLQGGVNTYGYVGGNALIRIDPLGLVEPTDHLIYPPETNCSFTIACHNKIVRGGIWGTLTLSAICTRVIGIPGFGSLCDIAVWSACGEATKKACRNDEKECKTIEFRDDSFLAL